MCYNEIVMENEELNTTRVDETQKNESTYSQKQVDDITNKVRDNAVKNWLKENFGENVDANSLVGEFKKNQETVKTLNNELVRVKNEFKTKEIKQAFISNYGGMENAFDSMLKANPQLLESENINTSLSNIKKSSPFFFKDDKTTIINLNEKAYKNFYVSGDKKTIDGSNLKLK